jgi:ubiquitin-like 1-activating enzyme E1 B
MCLAAGVTLLESGSTGYLGQVVPIRKGETECYECTTKPTQKVYPICTIRSTPDKPVHCIVWAKELYKLMFGVDSESMLYEDHTADGPRTGAHPSAAVLTRPNHEGAALEWIVAVLVEHFISDVQRKINVGLYKTSAVQPRPVSRESIDSFLLLLRRDESSLNSLPSSHSGWERDVWAQQECIEELVSSSLDAYRSTQGAPGGTSRKLEFDKDDRLAMRFVTAASNLRSSVFSIPMLSYYDAKGIAGNIIPAISSTNAVIAGLQVYRAESYIY